MQAALERFPRLRRVPGFVVPLGHYRNEYPEPVERASAREALGLPADAKVLVHFGRIRPCKNVPGLIAAFRSLDDPEAILVIAGKPVGSLEEAELQTLAGEDPRIRLDLRMVPSDLLQRYVSAADLAVLPFSAILNSSSALLALSLDRPVLLPRKGAMGELQEMVGTQWVRTYEGSLTGAELAAALRWALDVPREERAPLDAFGWEAIAEGTLRAYDAICRS
jgi:beta-1,4-mannosyltransferase